ncbi:hypothetical protein GCM10023185_09330 [Hymenobacter saemangeumensis]|uniref:PKD domain-containing protein n=1 Tax=Hymenobacter saemangeumensis TaxID=1084522 RepID=A0ABP8I459_9BACT
MIARIHPFFLAACLLLSLALTVQAQQVYQAESAVLLNGPTVGSSGGITYTEHITRRGSSTVSGTTAVPGSSVTFASVMVGEAKTYAVDFRYAAARPYASSLSIYVNGTDVTQALFPSTGDWSMWATHTVALNLRAGTNTVMLRYDEDDNGWINLDYIEVKPEASAAHYKNGAAPTAGWFPQELSVDKFTGTAHLFLPLHTVQANGVALPLGLAYAATGVKMNDQGSHVGINWALTGEVSISREVRGLPDDIAYVDAAEKRYGWLMYPTPTQPTSGLTPDAVINAVPNAPAAFSATACTATEATAWQALTQHGSLEHGRPTPRTWYDTEPDIFHYSLPGHSGKFVFDAQGNVRTIPFDHITITPVRDPTNAATGIANFVIRTADGTQYHFNFQHREIVTKKVVRKVVAPTCFLRDYWLYNLPDASPSVVYASAWKASDITTVAGERLEFDYFESSASEDPVLSLREVARGTDWTATVEEYRTQVKTTKQYLTSVASPTLRVKLNLVPFSEAYALRSVEVFSTANSSASPLLLRTYLLDYYTARPRWAEFSDYSLPRQFLRRIQLVTECSTQPLYEFAYDRVEIVPGNNPSLTRRDRRTVVDLPAPATGTGEQDYWGYYTPNGSQFLIPKLFVYPRLATNPASLPGAPYRLYEATGSAEAGVGFTLPGTDRRPAAYFNFTPALIGALTTITAPGGGKVLLEYEPHRFYDRLAAQSYPAGGTRIRAIRVQDPITGIEARREYSYQEADGKSSGVLLRMPRFAFAVPAAGTSPQQQWTAATVRSGEDLTEDPFETRALGYRRVSEQMTGKGQVVTEYHVLGSADENSVASDPAANIPFSWMRPIMGIARQGGSAGCPDLSPLQAGTGLYPFAPPTNYDFRRGLPQRISYLAEPASGSTPALVRQETFAYEYRNLERRGLGLVQGLAYELLSGGSSSAYAYAKYPILTDFLYAIRHQTETLPSSGIAANQTDTWYNYNSQGWLAGQGKTNSDGKGYRTRYKYLTDYPLTASPANTEKGRLYQAMRDRITLSAEKISATPVEAISEIVAGRNDIQFAGATLHTFALASAGTGMPTRPYQTLRWQPAGPLVLSAGYDSTRVELTAAGAELHISPRFRVASTLLETTPQLAPLTTRNTAGRQLAAVHLGYSNTLPVLQIANAQASEVVFSDFESLKPFAFSASTGTTVAKSAARTGSAGLELEANAFLSAQLPSSAAPAYRLSFWARPAAGTRPTITITVTGGAGGIPPALAPVSIASGNGQWLLHEVVVDLNGIPPANRSSFTLKLLTDADVQVDDVLFLPSSAAAASTTYDLIKGKTSETDERGQTLFYEYNPMSELVRVRDHNQAIVKQVEKVVAGRVPVLKPSFVVSGALHDREQITFTTCSSSGNLSYSWDFGDGTITGPGSNSSVQHSFNTGGLVRTYAVTLSARVPGQSNVYTSTQYLEITPAPVSVGSCTTGIISVDNCGVLPDVITDTCDPSYIPPASRPATNTYSVDIQRGSGLVYVWRFQEAPSTVTAVQPPWQVLAGQSSSFITVSTLGSIGRRTYQCTIYNTSGVALGSSQPFSILWYNSQNDPNTICNPAE